MAMVHLRQRTADMRPGAMKGYANLIVLGYLLKSFDRAHNEKSMSIDVADVAYNAWG